MDLPPPPPPPAPSGGAPLLPPPAAPPGPGPTDLAHGARHGRSRLSAAWRWVLGLGWCVVMGGLGALAQASFLVDADPFWLGFKPLPFALPVATLLALVSDARWALPLSALATVVLVVTTVVDAAQSNRIVALGEAACTASAVLLTLGAWLGRDRTPQPTVPRSAA